jgi:hypothetical protein
MVVFLQAVAERRRAGGAAALSKLFGPWDTRYMRHFD